MPDFEWTKAREEAAELVARGELGVGEIADRVGVTVRTLYEWRKAPEFSKRVDDFIEGFRAVLRSRAVGSVERRVERLNRDWLKLQRVIEERGASPEMRGVPGGETGHLVRTARPVGRGDDFEILYEFAVDTGLLKELREIEKQAAQELGQWAEKQEHTGGVTIRVEYADADAPPAAPGPG